MKPRLALSSQKYTEEEGLAASGSTVISPDKGGMQSRVRYLHALNNVLPGQALVIDALASPEDLGGDHIVRALPAELLQHEVETSELMKLTVAP